MADPLAALRPLHVAPFAEGAGLIAAMAMLGCGLALALLLLARLLARRGGARRSALATLAAARALPAQDRLVAQAALLRRVARTLDGETPPASHLAGEAWLLRLDRIFATAFFSKGDGRVFGEALYRRGALRDAGGVDVEEIDRALARFFDRLPA